jgi:hypothetical protein
MVSGFNRLFCQLVGLGFVARHRWAMNLNLVVGVAQRAGCRGWLVGGTDDAAAAAMGV